MTNKSILKLWQDNRERNSGILLAATGSDVVDVDLPIGTEEDRKVLKEIFGTDLYISGSQFREQLEAISSDEVIVRYNSPGGVATEGAAMRQAVIDAREQGRTVIGLGAGSIASAVTLPFLASTERVMGDTSLLLLHEARMMYMLFADGATAEMIEKDREMLQSRISSLGAINEAQTKIILAITDRDEEAVKTLLGEDRKMGAAEALDWKLIDRIDQPPKTEQPEPENRNRTPILLHKKETDMNEAELAKAKEDLKALVKAHADNEQKLKDDRQAFDLARAETMLDGHVARGALSPADKVTHLDGIKKSPLGVESGAALLNNSLSIIPDKQVHDPNPEPASHGGKVPKEPGKPEEKVDIDAMLSARIDKGATYIAAYKAVRKEFPEDMAAYEKADPLNGDFDQLCAWRPYGVGAVKAA